SRLNQPASVVINETMARRYWNGRDPVGTVLGVPTRGGVTGTVTIVGVVRDSAYYEVGEARLPFIYVPAESVRPNAVALFGRTWVDVNSLLPVLSHAANQVDPAIVAASATSFDAMRSAYLSPQRLLVAGAGVFGVLALLLTAVGLYGVV